MKFTIEVEVSLKRVSDLLCSALEGGSNYWYTITKFVKPPVVMVVDPNLGEFRHLDYPCSPGGALIIADREGDSKETWRLDLESMEKGLKVMQAKYPQHFTNFINENDDAETGDVFLQCCLFGEIVYG